MGTQPQTDKGAIDTRHVTGRRKLRFESMDAMLADVDRLVASEQAGQLKRLGNWTLSQAMGHLAVWSEYAYTGVPIKPPFIIRWLMRLRKNAFLNGSLPEGVKIPGVSGGTFGIEDGPLDAAVVRLRRVSERLKAEAPTIPSPLFGKLTHEEAIALQLRHAELHLSFFVP